MIDSLNSDEKRTVREYDLNAAFYQRTEPHLNDLGVSPGLLWARELMGDDPYCLDVGCGHGRSLPAFRNSGISRYVGIDPSRKCIEIARQNYPDADFRVASVYELGRQFPQESFDAFFAVTTLAHVPPHKLGRALRRIREVIRKDGVGCITMSPAHNSTLKLYQTRVITETHTGPFTTMYPFNLDEFITLLNENGFTLYGPIYNEVMLLMAVRAT